MFNLSDQELEQLYQPRPKPAAKNLRKDCRHEDFGVWMADVIKVKTPTGIVYLGTPCTAYRRFCKRCKYEQKGTGTAWGGNMKVVEIG